MSFVNTVDVIGDEVLSAKIIDRSITEIADNIIKGIGIYAFYQCTALTTADFPVATSIGQNAFGYCEELLAANIPLATSIGKAAFISCFKLTTANFPVATSIGDQAFQNCKALTNVCFPLAKSMGNSFFSCTALTTADFSVATSVGSSAFRSCSTLKALILRSETMCTLKNKDAFTYSSIESGTGYIYVPRALLSDDDATKDYRRATNWSTFANQFRALEDYTVDGTTTGELDETKI